MRYLALEIGRNAISLTDLFARALESGAEIPRRVAKRLYVSIGVCKGLALPSSRSEYFRFPVHPPDAIEERCRFENDISLWRRTHVLPEVGEFSAPIWKAALEGIDFLKYGGQASLTGIGSSTEGLRKGVGVIWKKGQSKIEHVGERLRVVNHTICIEVSSDRKRTSNRLSPVHKPKNFIISS